MFVLLFMHSIKSCCEFPSFSIDKTTYLIRVRRSSAGSQVIDWLIDMIDSLFFVTFFNICIAELYVIVYVYAIQFCWLRYQLSLKQRMHVVWFSISLWELLDAARLFSLIIFKVA